MNVCLKTNAGSRLEFVPWEAGAMAYSLAGRLEIPLKTDCFVNLMVWVIQRSIDLHSSQSARGCSLNSNLHQIKVCSRKLEPRVSITSRDSGQLTKACLLPLVLGGIRGMK